MFGYYRFEGIDAGGLYVFDVLSKAYQFTPQTVTVNDNVANLNFTANP